MLPPQSHSRTGMCMTGTKCTIWTAVTFHIRCIPQDRLRKCRISQQSASQIYSVCQIIFQHVPDAVHKLPPAFQLNTVFYIENKYICFYKTTTYKDDFYYYVKFLEKNEALSRKRDIYTFDLDDLQLNNVLLTNETRLILKNLRRSFEFGLIAFQNIECYYLSKEIYKSI